MKANELTSLLKIVAQSLHKDYEPNVFNELFWDFEYPELNCKVELHLVPEGFELERRETPKGEI